MRVVCKNLRDNAQIEQPIQNKISLVWNGAGRSNIGIVIPEVATYLWLSSFVSLIRTNDIFSSSKFGVDNADKSKISKTRIRIRPDCFGADKRIHAPPSGKGDFKATVVSRIITGEARNARQTGHCAPMNLFAGFWIVGKMYSGRESGTLSPSLKLKQVIKLHLFVSEECLFPVAASKHAVEENNGEIPAVRYGSGRRIWIRKSAYTMEKTGADRVWSWLLALNQWFWLKNSARRLALEEPARSFTKTCALWDQAAKLFYVHCISDRCLNHTASARLRCGAVWILDLYGLRYGCGSGKVFSGLWRLATGLWPYHAAVLSIVLYLCAENITPERAI